MSNELEQPTSATRPFSQLAELDQPKQDGARGRCVSQRGCLLITIAFVATLILVVNLVL